MRTRFLHDPDQPSRCTLRCEDAWGQVHERDLFAPPGGGFVREDWRNPRQVCEGLANTGVTLTWTPKHGPLAALVRRERRRALAAERRLRPAT